ncbi:E3 ubiquitin-protein ligase RNF220a isoform X6 [Labeo rohita]|uniref:E3 ubiquitin-protein ligase RNF220a isoform X6 n=1 Tax=Labeo rohita TaxID=84645 RepID=UPI0021E1D776|nr:E3 ubiquitin-protein ligase RNF220a isoform X6 [Labeo rohita]
MDLHRAAFKMESSSYLPNPLASPALMVLASTAEASRDASIPCQQPRPFGVPVSVEKDVHLPFNNGSYTFASMYHRQGAVPPGFPNRDFPPSLLHLHHQFAPPNLDCSPISMLNHSGVGAFRPFASPPEDRDGAGGGYQSAFTPAKRLKGCLEAEASPHLRYSDAEGKEYDFGGAQIPSSSPSALKAVEDAGKKIFAVSGLLSDRETSSSPEDRIERCKKKVSLYDSQAPICPICQVLLRPGELQEHMEQEMERLTHMHISKNPSHKDINAAPGTPKSLLLSVHIKREGESPVVSPLSSDEAHHSDRYQTFLRVRANRQTRLNVDDLCWCRRYAKESFKSPPIPVPRGVPLAPCCLRHARIGKMKRRKPEDGQVCPLCSAPLTGTEEEMSRHVEQCLFKREGATEEDSADVEGENGTRFEEYEWCGQKRVRATTLLEGGFREMPSTSNGESSKQEPSSSSSSSTPRTCKNSEIEKITEDSTATTLEALKARIRELEKQILRGDRYKCLICMRKPTQTGADGKIQAVERHGSAETLQLGVYCLYRGYVTGCSTATAGSSGIKKLLPLRRDSYTMPLTSIQCWHVHCEECWLRTLGNKKLCPQCNTITSPGDLRRVYL